MPVELEEYWVKMAKFRFPDISTNKRFFEKAAVGLLTYFLMVSSTSSKPIDLILPSKAADSVWYCWVCLDRFSDSHSLDEFCIEHFDMTISRKYDFIPNSDEMELALARSYVLNCQLDGLDFQYCQLPSLFTLDCKLKMAWGWNFFVSKQQNQYISHNCLNKYGMPSGRNEETEIVMHSSICLHSFFLLGFLQEYPPPYLIFKNVQDEEWGNFVLLNEFP